MSRGWTKWCNHFFIRVREQMHLIRTLILSRIRTSGLQFARVSLTPEPGAGAYTTQNRCVASVMRRPHVLAFVDKAGHGQCIPRRADLTRLECGDGS